MELTYKLADRIEQNGYSLKEFALLAPQLVRAFKAAGILKSDYGWRSQIKRRSLLKKIVKYRDEHGLTNKRLSFLVCLEVGFRTEHLRPRHLCYQGCPHHLGNFTFWERLRFNR